MSPEQLAPERRDHLLEAAFGVFLRYGFRKTAMQDVATAAGISRQGLYLHFPAKEQLFVATVEWISGRILEEATAGLARPGSLEDRLVSALTSWSGRFVGKIGPDATDLLETGHRLAGPVLADVDARFLTVFTAAIADARLAEAYHRMGVDTDASGLAWTLLATSHGFKSRAETAAAYEAGVRHAVQLLCAPLVGAVVLEASLQTASHDATKST